MSNKIFRHFIFLGFIFSLFSCGNDSGTNIEFTINFETNCSLTLKSIKVKDGNKLTQPELLNEGYDLIGWFEDKNFNDLFDFDTPIHNDYTLYAKWEESDPVFSNDVDENAHYLTFYGEGREKIISLITSSKDTFLTLEPFFPKIDMSLLSGYEYEWRFDEKYGYDDLIIGTDINGDPVTKQFPKVYSETFKNIDVFASFMVAD